MQNFPHLKGIAVGSKVIFGRPNGEQTKGEVIKINRKSVKVRQTEVRFGNGRTRSVGAVWSVHPSLLRLEGGDAPTPRTQAPQTSNTRTFKRGEKVSFRGSKGEVLEGFVKSVNRKTVSVEPQKGSLQYWRVPFGLFV
jgi:hypothetical protein